LPLQLLGGAKVGKSSLLRWVERNVPAGRPIAWIEPGGGLSPVKLVSEIARKVGRPEVAARLASEDASLHLAQEQLQALGELVLVIDEADKLATVGRGFDEGFFEMVRGLVERRALTWVSASRRDLYEVFRQQGLTSRFLNSSEKLWLGPLDAEAARRLAAMGTPAHADRMLQEAGGFAYGLQWLGDRLLRGTDDVDEVCDAFRAEMERRVFTSWWKDLLAEERALLKACVRAKVHPGGEETLRRRLNGLSDRGILVKEKGSYQLAPGKAWQEFVLHVD
jgi:hypothetical protein